SVESLPTCAAQGCAGKVTGDRALAHGINPFDKRPMVAGRSIATRRISAKSRNRNQAVGGNPPSYTLSFNL
ncbi:hypothetical protein, partial [Pseudomonas sp. SHC52]|uniref:hypothetical protein n=1 Tax=Pseudomonas sp. SHC52 TaxID=984195 RepID=UPI001C45366B